MKITLQHTTDFHGPESRGVTLAIDKDDLTLDEMWQDLIKPALLAMTWGEDTVDGWLDKLPEKPADDEPSPLIDVNRKYRTRNGRDVTGLALVAPISSLYPYVANVSGETRSYTKHGRWHSDLDSHYLDLIPAEEGVQ